MPTESELLFDRLSKKAEAISDAIDERQRVIDSDLTRLEKELFSRLQADLFGELEFDNGRLKTSPKNILLLLRIDQAFNRWLREFQNVVVRDFATDLLRIAALTGEMYKPGNPEKIVNQIASDNATLRAAIGIDEKGRVIPGSILYDISTVGQVRQDIKKVILQAINRQQTLRDFSTALRNFITGTPNTAGRLKSYWRTYAYDLFNQATEIKNEQFRRGLDLEWFIYTGSIIKDSREFCIKKAGKVFAVIEADREWPKDPDLIGKKTGIPYVPRIDRGRWNCRHRIRYITEETAKQLDPKKVEAIKKKYGG